jgi:hypothetical protein
MEAGRLAMAGRGGNAMSLTHGQSISQHVTAFPFVEWDGLAVDGDDEMETSADGMVYLTANRKIKEKGRQRRKEEQKQGLLCQLINWTAMLYVPGCGFRAERPRYAFEPRPSPSRARVDKGLEWNVVQRQQLQTQIRREYAYER